MPKTPNKPRLWRKVMRWYHCKGLNDYERAFLYGANVQGWRDAVDALRALRLLPAQDEHNQNPDLDWPTSGLAFYAPSAASNLRH